MSIDEETREIMDCFLEESLEVLEDVEPLLMRLEAGRCEDNRDCIDAIFRMFHSMKGSAGYLQFTSIAAVTHAAETLLEEVRNERKRLDQQTIQSLCATVDYLRERLSAVEKTLSDAGDEGRGLDLVRALSSLVAMGPVSGSETPEDWGDVFDETLDEDESPRVLFSLDLSGEDAGSISALGFLREGLGRLGACELRLRGVVGPVVDPVALKQSVADLGWLSRRAAALGFHDLEAFARALEASVRRVGNGEAKRSASDTLGALLAGLDTLRFAMRTLPETPKIEGLAGKMAALEAPMHLPAEDTRLGKILVDADFASEREVQQALISQSLEGAPVGEVLIAKVGLHPQDLEDALAHQRAKRRGQNPPPLKRPRERRKQETLRVDLAKLDDLIETVSELMRATHVGPDSTGDRDEIWRKAQAIHDVAVSLRMVALEGTFRKMMRLVREVSRSRGKNVRLEMSGGETEVGRSVVEWVADPLVHLLRNAVDHGIEAVEDRLAMGKPEVGTIWLEACRQGAEVQISVRDDGGGMNERQIYAQARERGLTSVPFEALSREQIFAFIFDAGFSTAAVVSDISGRGIGMDVVRRNVERLGGCVRVSSEQGLGATVTLRIPLGLSVLDGTVARMGQSEAGAR
jgi:two-component system, chemotaxis family, sensor kinase CheA